MLRPPTWAACTSCPSFYMLLFSALSRWAKSESVEDTGVDDEWLCPSLPLWNLLPSTCVWQGRRTGLGCESPSTPCSLPKPGAACSLPAASCGPMLVGEKPSLPAHIHCCGTNRAHFRAALPSLWSGGWALHSSVSLLAADACCCPAAQPKQWPHHKEFQHQKCVQKSEKNPEVLPWHLNTWWRARHYRSIMRVFTVPELTDSKESLNTWTTAELMPEVQTQRESRTEGLDIR